ncbi:hypothetical protein SAMN04487952_1165 [Halomonas caseinilytica]|nr:hypothetical protein SAMN04487952_1165 [Halomonas caseinilytica]
MHLLSFLVLRILLKHTLKHPLCSSKSTMIEVELSSCDHHPSMLSSFLPQLPKHRECRTLQPSLSYNIKINDL